MRYKKPAVVMLCAAVLLVAGCILAFGTNPAAKKPSSPDAAADTETAAQAGAPSDTQNLSPAEQALEDDLIEKNAERWAEAFCGRSGAGIAAMSNDKTKESLKNRELLDENGGFGFSSPWPYDSDYDIIDASNNTAQILYYARTSDPHVSVWKETLTFTQPENQPIQVTNEKLEYFDSISSLTEFYAAYATGISDTPMDYLTNGLAEQLNQNALLSSSWLHPMLANPSSAAVYLLNLDPDSVTTDTLQEQEDGSVPVNLVFSEDASVTVKMVSLFAEEPASGIWIPQDYEDESKGGSPENLLYSNDTFLGQYGEEGGYLFNEDFFSAYDEIPVYSATADITHDGIPDRVDLIVARYKDSYIVSAMDALKSTGLAYIKAYRGTAPGRFEASPFFISHEVASAHAGNGQLSLVKKDGQDYLMTSCIYEMQGSASYSYTVFYIDTEQKTAVCADEKSVGFSVSEDGNENEPLRKDVIPDFKEHLEQWIDDAILLVSCDVSSDPEIYLTEPNKEYPASDYFNTVWER